MIMITGGAFQGKRDCLKRLYKVPENEIINGAECQFSKVFTAVAIADYHELVRRILSEKINVIEFTEKLCRENPNAAIIIDEIGCGIIPIERSERIYREEVGRAGCIIAANCDTVIRVFCGIPQAIKGVLP